MWLGGIGGGNPQLFCIGWTDSSDWEIEWDKAWWNNVLLPHRWSIVCQLQSARNGRTVHSSAHGLLKRWACLWMPKAHRGAQLDFAYLSSPLSVKNAPLDLFVHMNFFSLWKTHLQEVRGPGKAGAWEIVAKIDDQ